MIEGMRRQDPLPRPQLAVPVKLVKTASKIAQGTKDQKMHAVTDLMMIAFYYLLRSGEYTKPKFVTTKEGKRRKATRTVQFRVKDVGFFNGCFSINREKATLKELLQATTVTLRIHDQKNGRMGDCITQEAIPNGPTQALARRVHHILSNGGNGDSLLCDFCLQDGTWDCVQSADVVRHVRVISKLLRMDKQGIDPDLIGAHSLRAGGAMAMKLQGVSDTIIMKQGRWSSLTFLMYIHNQIAHLSKGLSQKMSTDIEFINVANFG